MYTTGGEISISISISLCCEPETITSTRLSFLQNTHNVLILHFNSQFLRFHNICLME